MRDLLFYLTVFAAGGLLAGLMVIVVIDRMFRRR